MSKHDYDFYGWTQETAELLRQHRFADLDLEALIDEVESMGRNERSELVNRLAVLIAHLLKWEHQPARKGKSWRLTIEHQRDEIPEVLAENPSLKPELARALKRAYKKAVFLAAKETDLDKTDFPAECPWAIDQVLDENFYPEV
jgi:hypothetical protein